MNVFQEKLRDYSAGRVLDFGSGAGGSVRGIIQAVKKFEIIIGVDTTEPQHEMDSEPFNTPGFDYVQNQGLPLSFKTDCFDIVCMSNVLSITCPLPHARMCFQT